MERPHPRQGHQILRRTIGQFFRLANLHVIHVLRLKTSLSSITVLERDPFSLTTLQALYTTSSVKKAVVFKLSFDMRQMSLRSSRNLRQWVYHFLFKHF